MIYETKKQAIQQAFQYLGSNNDRIREDAVKRLGEFGFAHPQILERLRKIKEEDPSPSVREAASRSLTVLLSSFTQPQPPGPEVSHPIDGPRRVTPLSQPPSLEARSRDDEFHKILTPSQPSNENQLRLIELLEKQNDLLEEIKSILLKSSISQSEFSKNLRAQVIDFDMSIDSMVAFMFKWIIASIPVGIVVGIVWVLLVELVRR